MASCNHCGTVIVFGGKRLGDRRYCSERCLQASVTRMAAQGLASEVPEELIQRQVTAVHQGNCPKCGRPGPIDVYFSHRVWSLIKVTSWSSRPHVSCRRCGVKAQIGDLLFSALFGWWGIPFGFLMTPYQIGRNIVGMVRGPDPGQPSPYLEQMVRLDIAKRAVVAQSDVERNATAEQTRGAQTSK
jgi:hypothetical protein